MNLKTKVQDGVGAGAIAGGVFILHTADLGLITGIPYDTLSSAKFGHPKQNSGGGPLSGKKKISGSGERMLGVTVLPMNFTLIKCQLAKPTKLMGFH